MNLLIYANVQLIASIQENPLERILDYTPIILPQGDSLHFFRFIMSDRALIQAIQKLRKSLFGRTYLTCFMVPKDNLVILI